MTKEVREDMREILDALPKTGRDIRTKVNAETPLEGLRKCLHKAQRKAYRRRK